ncbi:hypothetical protein H6P81_001535 [Aristolochia fimbriata]|uniref:Uncharacterized protein n=1 Tax=Aristolochia fimbriata TaxID=158543 RepID=A0AAV7F797_ARIFI|nr:hypothetical protein H6P81_001535 [Aristolochia fimbriata]
MRNLHDRTTIGCGYKACSQHTRALNLREGSLTSPVKVLRPQITDGSMELEHREKTKKKKGKHEEIAENEMRKKT